MHSSYFSAYMLQIFAGGSYKADPRSPVGTAYGFSAPNQHSLALSNTSSLFEMASREFMKNMNPEMMSGSKKRISKRQAEPLMDMNAMSESMMRVNVQPFFPKPDMSGIIIIGPLFIFVAWLN